MYRLFENFRLLLSLIKDYWSGKYRKIPYWSLAVILITFLYLINPFDFIPDYILGLGQIDDAILLGLCLYFLDKDLRVYKAWKGGKTPIE